MSSRLLIWLASASDCCNAAAATKLSPRRGQYRRRLWIHLTSSGTWPSFSACFLASTNIRSAFFWVAKFVICPAHVP